MGMHVFEESLSNTNPTGELGNQVPIDVPKNDFDWDAPTQLNPKSQKDKEEGQKIPARIPKDSPYRVFNLGAQEKMPDGIDATNLTNAEVRDILANRYRSLGFSEGVIQLLLTGQQDQLDM